jgi:hypothetical protein
MIQRVQTLFLLGIVLLSLLLFFFPFEHINVGDTKYFLNLMPGCLKNMVKPFIYIPIALNGVIILLSLYTIFKFKKRKKQIKFTQLIMVLSGLLIGNLFTFNFLKTEEAFSVNYRIVAFIPAINFVLAFLARYFIKKDEDLVKSADRIR